MTEFQLKYNNKVSEIIIPSTWNELSINHLMYIATNWNIWRDITLYEDSLLKEKCKLFLQLVPKKLRSEIKKAIPNISDESLYELSTLTNFVFEDNTLTKCPIQTIKSDSIILHAPSDKLGNIVALEFIAADHYYMQYHTNRDNESIVKLIASLYRPRIENSLERIPFEKQNDLRYYASVNTLSDSEKQLILLWYIGSRTAIVKKYSDIFSTDHQEEAKSSGWLPIILELAGNKFGTFEQTAHTDFHLILMELREMRNRKPKNNA